MCAERFVSKVVAHAIVYVIISVLVILSFHDEFNYWKCDINRFASYSAIANTHVITCEKYSRHAVKVMSEEYLLTSVLIYK